MKQYPLQFAVGNEVEIEVQAMLSLGRIERSNSPYNSPTLLVKNPDGTNRFCVDFRQLNHHMVSDAESIPRAG